MFDYLLQPNSRTYFRTSGDPMTQSIDSTDRNSPDADQHTMNSTTKKILQVLNGASLLIVIFINYLANTGTFNGTIVGEVSAQYQNYFTPAGYAFSIWGLIYLGLLAFIAYQGRSLFIKGADDDIVNQTGWWFLISCLANILWLLSWLYEYTGLSVIVMFLLLFSLFRIVVNTRMELYDAPISRIAFVWWPFSLYSGWVTVALITNIAAYLTKIDWQGFGLPEVTWAVIMILATGLINLLLTWTRNMREFALVGVWALIAIAVANWNGPQVIVVFSLAVSGVLFLSSAIHGYINRASSPFKG